ncbi:elongin C [Spiromyces aspiralis]|uniref:Elongin C n=1 Tax=Spiromyces aspiralis TaxID=68401 RepID=A0ACC1HRT1_9FUNG|nr:elongin C [Spiromyces aspiralis]
MATSIAADQKGGNSDNVMVKLVSGDGFEFILERSVAVMAGTIKSMLEVSNMFVESSERVIRIDEIAGDVLEKVVQYLFYKYRYADKAGKVDIPDFPIEPEITLALMVAADYLDC